MIARPKRKVHEQEEKRRKALEEDRAKREEAERKVREKYERGEINRFPNPR